MCVYVCAYVNVEMCQVYVQFDLYAFGGDPCFDIFEIFVLFVNLPF